MLLTGSLLDRVPGRKYVQALRFAELTLRAPLPRPATLVSWRAKLPADFQVALRAPRASVVSKRGPLRSDPELDASLEWLIQAADAVGARAVVLPTPGDLTPGPRSRELLAAYVARLPRSAGRFYVWSPAGLWEPDDTNELCTRLGIVRAFDPLEMPRPTGDIVYAQLRAMGHRLSFSPAALEDALAVIGGAPTTQAFVSVDAARGFDIARRLMQIAADQQLFGLAPGDVAPSDDEASDEDDDGETDEDADDEDDDADSP
jgi:uncharacterized protein YecE (DUF72 family)